jgi:hypothetical protein
LDFGRRTDSYECLAGAIGQSVVAAAFRSGWGYLVVTGYTGRCPLKKFLAKKFGEDVKNYDITDD